MVSLGNDLHKNGGVFPYGKCWRLSVVGVLFLFIGDVLRSGDQHRLMFRSLDAWPNFRKAPAGSAEHRIRMV